MNAEVVAELEESRLLMIRRVKAMSVAERVALFERLSRDPDGNGAGVAPKPAMKKFTVKSRS